MDEEYIYNRKKIVNRIGMIITGLVPGSLLAVSLIFVINLFISDANSDTLGIMAIFGFIAGIYVLIVVGFTIWPFIGFIISMKRDKVNPYGILCIILTALEWIIIFHFINILGAEINIVFPILSIVICVAEIIALAKYN